MLNPNILFHHILPHSHYCKTQIISVAIKKNSYLHFTFAHHHVLVFKINQSTYFTFQSGRVQVWAWFSIGDGFNDFDSFEPSLYGCEMYKIMCIFPLLCYFHEFEFCCISINLSVFFSNFRCRDIRDVITLSGLMKKCLKELRN